MFAIIKNLGAVGHSISHTGRQLFMSHTRAGTTTTGTATERPWRRPTRPSGPTIRSPQTAGHPDELSRPGPEEGGGTPQARGARNRPAVLLLACIGLLAAALPVQAQTLPVWSTTIVVGESSGGTRGYLSQIYGSITDDNFEFSSATYTVS